MAIAVQLAHFLRISALLPVPNVSNMAPRQSSLQPAWEPEAWTVGERVTRAKRYNGNVVPENWAK